MVKLPESAEYHIFPYWPTIWRCYLTDAPSNCIMFQFKGTHIFKFFNSTSFDELPIQHIICELLKTEIRFDGLI